MKKLGGPWPPPPTPPFPPPMIVPKAILPSMCIFAKINGHRFAKYISPISAYPLLGVVFVHEHSTINNYLLLSTYSVLSTYFLPVEI